MKIFSRFLSTQLVFITVAALLISCSSSGNSKKSFTPITQGNGTWSITLLKYEASDSLEGTSSIVQYNGEVTYNDLSEKPTSGNTFLLLKMTITKEKSGASSFKWENFYIMDESGNKYFRLKNDTFLESYNLPRIKSTNLTLGTNEGFICLEIPLSIAEQNLTVVYDSADGMIEIPFQ